MSMMGARPRKRTGGKRAVLTPLSMTVTRPRRKGIGRKPRLPVSGTPEARERYMREQGK